MRQSFVLSASRCRATRTRGCSPAAGASATISARRPGLRGDGALAPSACAHPAASTPTRAQGHARRARRLHRRRLPGRQARGRSRTIRCRRRKYDMKLTGPGGGAIFIGPHMLLPADKARHVGEAVAMVVAETARRRSTPPKRSRSTTRCCRASSTPRTRCSPARRRSGTRRPDNILVDTRFGDAAATDGPSPAADHVVSMDFHIGRVTGVPMEPRAALGALRWRERPLHAQCRQRRRGAAEARTGRACSASSPTSCACCPTMSAAISAPATASIVEFGLVLWAAQQARPAGQVHRHAARRAFLSDYQGRDLVTKVALALRKDGRFLAHARRPISAMSARAASRCRRSARAPG